MADIDASDFARLIEKLRSAPGRSGLDSKLAQAMDVAGRHELVVVPGELDGLTAVRIDNQQMSPSDVVEAAGALGARCLYLETDRFDETSLVWVKEDLDHEDYRAAHPTPIASLPDQLELATKHLRGSLSELTVGFPHGGVVHLWSEVADWRADLRAASTLLLAAAEEDDDEDADGLAVDERDSLVRELSGLPELRKVRRVRARDIDHPRLTELAGPTGRNWLAESVVRDALQLIEPQREMAEASALGRLDELAGALARHAEFARTTTAEMRRKMADRFLADETGFALSRSIATKLEQRARKILKTGSSGSSQLW